MLKPITTCRNMARNYGYRTFFMNLRVKNELSFIEKKNKYGTTSKIVLIPSQLLPLYWFDC